MITNPDSSTSVVNNMYVLTIYYKSNRIESTFNLTEKMVKCSEYLMTINNTINSINLSIEPEQLYHILRFITEEITIEEMNGLISWENLLKNKYLLNFCYLSDENLTKIDEYYMSKYYNFYNFYNHKTINTLLTSYNQTTDKKLQHKIETIFIQRSKHKGYKKAAKIYKRVLGYFKESESKYEVYYEQHKKYMVDLFGIFIYNRHYDISITRMDLSHCYSITTLPPEIGNLTNLTELKLSCCGSLTTLPPEIGNLTYLTQLNINSLHIRSSSLNLMSYFN